MLLQKRLSDGRIALETASLLHLLGAGWRGTVTNLSWNLLEPTVWRSHPFESWLVRRVKVRKERGFELFLSCAQHECDTMNEGETDWRFLTLSLYLNSPLLYRMASFSLHLPPTHTQLNAQIQFGCSCTSKHLRKSSFEHFIYSLGDCGENLSPALFHWLHSSTTEKTAIICRLQ